MGGKKSKRKGYKGEKEFADLFDGGQRVPLSGSQDGFYNDVLIPFKGKTIKAEVKRRKSGLKFVYDVLEDEREQPDILAFRADRKPWIICMPLELFKELIGEGVE